MKQISPTPATEGVSPAVTKASGSNFAYAFLVLPKPKREALYAIYAFCRISDDVVDEASSAGAPGATPAERLKAWRAELDACFRGEPRHPVTRRLADVLARLPSTDLLAERVEMAS
jgi:phytoene/squalene synthetase